MLKKKGDPEKLHRDQCGAEAKLQITTSCLNKKPFYRYTAWHFEKTKKALVI